MMFRSTHFIFFVSMCFVSINTTLHRRPRWVYDDYGCRTPGGGVGDCINIRDCKSMIDFLSNIHNLDNRTNEIIRSYKCGFSSQGPKVCCPSTPIVVPTVAPPRKEDIENHSKLPLLSLDDCGKSKGSGRIVNGNKTNIFEFPWMAALKYSQRGNTIYSCGGSLITRNYVLTAAHCINKSTLILTGVRLGEHNFDTEIDCDPLSVNECAPPVQDFDVSVNDAMVHPNYNAVTNANDIALIKLRSSADISVASVNTICLPIQPAARNPRTLKRLIVTGWGVTETGLASSDLLKVIVPIVDNSRCEQKYKRLTRGTEINITDKQLCAGGKKQQDSCVGDSGGPTMAEVNLNGNLRTVQYGVVSFGPLECGSRNLPVVHTRVTSYVDWILENISD